MSKGASAKDVRTWWYLKTVIRQGDKAMIVIPGMPGYLRICWIGHRLLVHIHKCILDIGSRRKFEGHWPCNGQGPLIQSVKSPIRYAAPGGGINVTKRP